MARATGFITGGVLHFLLSILFWQYSNFVLPLRQYKVVGNEIIQLRDLDFKFQAGRCLNYNDEKVLLVGCFNNDKETWLFDGENYVSQPARPKYQHFAGGLAKYEHEGEVGVVLSAGEFEFFGTTEFYSPSKNTWTYKNLTEGHEWFYGFTMATFDNQVYIFGGKIHSNFGNGPFSLARNWERSLPNCFICICYTTYVEPLLALMCGKWTQNLALLKRHKRWSPWRDMISAPFNKTIELSILAAGRHSLLSAGP